MVVYRVRISWSLSGRTSAWHRSTCLSYCFIIICTSLPVVSSTSEHGGTASDVNHERGITNLYDTHDTNAFGTKQQAHIQQGNFLGMVSSNVLYIFTEVHPQHASRILIRSHHCTKLKHAGCAATSSFVERSLVPHTFL